MICADGQGPDLWRIGLWDGTRIEVAGEDELGSVQVIDAWGGIAICKEGWCCLGDGVFDSRLSEL